MPEPAAESKADPKPDPQTDPTPDSPPASGPETSLRRFLRALNLPVAVPALALIAGAGLSVLALGLFPDAPIDYALLTAAFALAWVVGFVTPGAPAGLGVREALLLAMLSHGMGASNASLLIVALRIATTLGDMLCFALGLAMMPRVRRPVRVPGPGVSRDASGHDRQP